MKADLTIQLINGLTLDKVPSGRGRPRVSDLREESREVKDKPRPEYSTSPILWESNRAVEAITAAGDGASLASRPIPADVRYFPWVSSWKSRGRTDYEALRVGAGSARSATFLPAGIETDRSRSSRMGQSGRSSPWQQ